jgi:hypothetical protein
MPRKKSELNLKLRPILDAHGPYTIMSTLAELLREDAAKHKKACDFEREALAKEVARHVEQVRDTPMRR